jgi:hypothetical protein
VTNLSKLRVSLTKHGAHKIALLLGQFKRDEVLKHLNNSVPGINIDSVQARKNLSVNIKNELPEIWDDVRRMGEEAINALVLLAIASSHEQLLKALQQGATTKRYAGRLEKGVVLNGKAFTNFKHTLKELGYGTKETDEKIEYSFANIFSINGLSKLAAILFALKLKEANWDAENSLEDELINLSFHTAFSIDEATFRKWISSGIRQSFDSLIDADDHFFSSDDENLEQRSFTFVSGHTPKKIGKVKVNLPSKAIEAVLLHNAIQTKLYEKLATEYGKKCVGTENHSGSSTLIDVVVKTKEFCWFYEIKTAYSVKVCIRQAIPQLLEYAYWQCDQNRASKLIIVGPAPVTENSKRYLEFLRATFNLPLYYEQCQG